MKNKGRLLLTAGVLLVSTICLTFSRFGLLSAVDAVHREQSTKAKFETSETNLRTMSNMMVGSVESFNEARSFDIYYGDVDRIEQVVKGLSGITLEQITVVDPTNGFVDEKIYESGDTPIAVRCDVMVVDIIKSLDILAKMELPVYSVYFDGTNKLGVTFLTGGEV